MNQMESGLLWLNDRIGQSVNASIVFDIGDYSVTILEGEGILEHWSTRHPHGLGLGPRDDVAGWYCVGETRLDVTELGSAEVTTMFDELMVEFGNGVFLRVLTQEELPEDGEEEAEES